MFNLFSLLYLAFAFYVADSKICLQYPAWDITDSDNYARVSKARRAIFRKAHQSNLSVSSDLHKEMVLNLLKKKKKIKLTFIWVPSSFWLDGQAWNIVLCSDCQALTYFILNCRWMGCWFQICMYLPTCFTPTYLAEEWKLLNTGKRRKLTVLLPMPQDQSLPLG